MQILMLIVCVDYGIYSFNYVFLSYVKEFIISLNYFKKMQLINYKHAINKLNYR